MLSKPLIGEPRLKFRRPSTIAVTHPFDHSVKALRVQGALARAGNAELQVLFVADEEVDGGNDGSVDLHCPHGAPRGSVPELLAEVQVVGDDVAGACAALTAWRIVFDVFSEREA